MTTRVRNDLDIPGVCGYRGCGEPVNHTDPHELGLCTAHEQQAKDDLSMDINPRKTPRPRKAPQHTTGAPSLAYRQGPVVYRFTTTRQMLTILATRGEHRIPIQLTYADAHRLASFLAKHT